MIYGKIHGVGVEVQPPVYVAGYSKPISPPTIVSVQPSANLTYATRVAIAHSGLTVNPNIGVKPPIYHAPSISPSTVVSPPVIHHPTIHIPFVSPPKTISPPSVISPPTVQPPSVISPPTVQPPSVISPSVTPSTCSASGYSGILGLVTTVIGGYK